MSDIKKYKYIIVSSGGQMLWGLNEITKERLVRVKQELDDQIIDVENMTYYDKDNNSWEQLKGN